MSAKTTLGYSEMVFAPQDYMTWRERIPNVPTKGLSGITLSADHIYRIAKSSPSGTVITAKFFDNKKPTIVVDSENDRWFGMFFPTDDVNSPVDAKPPEWLA